MLHFFNWNIFSWLSWSALPSICKPLSTRQYVVFCNSLNFFSTASSIVTIAETSHPTAVTIAYIGPCIMQPLALGLAGLSSLSGARR
jgi:hypothetical protein